MKPTLTRKEMAELLKCCTRTIARREQTSLAGFRVPGIKPARYSAARLRFLLRYIKQDAP
jgi:hypothetical protein